MLGCNTAGGRRRGGRGARFVPGRNGIRWRCPFACTGRFSSRSASPVPSVPGDAGTARLRPRSVGNWERDLGGLRNDDAAGQASGTGRRRHRRREPHDERRVFMEMRRGEAMREDAAASTRLELTRLSVVSSARPRRRWRISQTWQCRWRRALFVDRPVRGRTRVALGARPRRTGRVDEETTRRGSRHSIVLG